MKNWAKVLFPIFVILLLIIIVIYGIIIKNKIFVYNYAKKMESLANANEKSTFSVDKIYLCNSANVNETKKMKNLSVYQYTDMALYINNSEEELGLINENIEKELYIDDIEISTQNLGSQSLGYINLLKIGNKDEKVSFAENNRIDFNIVHNNMENENANYENPTFYADCSNPISLRYINNIISKYNIEGGSVAKFDGSLLKKIEVKPEDIACNVSFRINIITDDEKKHNCVMSLNVPLKDIYDGTTIKTANTKMCNYRFFKNF